MNKYKLLDLILNNQIKIYKFINTSIINKKY